MIPACDKCRIRNARVKVIEKCDGINVASYFCNECYERYNQLHLDVHDFLSFSEKELGFLEATFRVGDEVITSTGEVGTIVDICTCKSCQERGFYEPMVETKIGNGRIYITDNSKRNNFSGFYKIGERVFGNINRDSLLYDIKDTNEQINSLTRCQTELLKQLEVIDKIYNTTK